MTATTISGPSISSSSLVRGALLAFIVLALAAVAFVVGHVTTGSGTHLVSSVTSSHYWPQVACSVGRPC